MYLNPFIHSITLEYDKAIFQINTVKKIFFYESVHSKDFSVVYAITFLSHH